jgi:hypothetical protein
MHSQYTSPPQPPLMCNPGAEPRSLPWQPGDGGHYKVPAGYPILLPALDESLKLCVHRDQLSLVM